MCERIKKIEIDIRKKNYVYTSRYSIRIWVGPSSMRNKNLSSSLKKSFLSSISCVLITKKVRKTEGWLFYKNMKNCNISLTKKCIYLTKQLDI